MSDTHFGFSTVDEAAKAGHVRGVFDSVASKYDVMNDLMSLGMHRAWKAYAVAVAKPDFEHARTLMHGDRRRLRGVRCEAGHDGGDAEADSERRV